MILSWFPLTFTNNKVPLEWGQSAWNRPGMIILSRKAPLPTATYAQERWESLSKLNPKRIWGLVFNRAKTNQEIELMGHAVETAAAVLIYDRNEMEYLLRESRGMAAHYSCFKGWSEARLVHEMQARMPEARRWVAKRMDHLLDVKERVG